ncbi:phage tail sheath protein [Escherichia coli]|uniref:Phage tail sheath protein n=1 Tax=Escherichia coli TaxID=562 RepID=A0A377E2G0_ECOLX|nr:phage tail sheath protein [Escherichia coli]
MTEQQTLLSHGVATAYVESGYCAFSVMSHVQEKRLRVADNSYLDSETLHTTRMYCAN